MDDSESVMIEGENYEVVDECIGEEDTVNQDQCAIKESSSSQVEEAKSPVTESTTTDNADEKISSDDKGVEDKCKDDETETKSMYDSSNQITQNEDKPIEQIETTTDSIANTEMDNLAGNQTETVDSVMEESQKQVIDSVVEENQMEAMDNVTEENREEAMGDVIMEDNQNEPIDDVIMEENRKMAMDDVIIEENRKMGIDDVVVEENQKMAMEDVIMEDSGQVEHIDKNSAAGSEQSKEEEIVIQDEKIGNNESLSQDTNPVIECVTIKDDDQDIIEITPTSCEKRTKGNDDWYNEKLAAKESAIKDRLSKLARVLEFSYPSYKKWLELSEKLHGTPICKLEPPRRCPLDKPYTNRWKFICNRKNIQETEKEADADDTSSNKNTETAWRLELTEAWGVNINNDSEFPSFVFRAVKIFEDFLQTTEQLQEQSAENFTDDISIEMEQKKETFDAKQQWLWLLVRSNNMDELMLFATGRNISRSTMDRLKQVFESGPGKDCNVKSLYCKSINKHNDTTITNTTFLVGSEALDEIVGGIKIQLAPKTNFWSNAAGAENIGKTAAQLLAPTKTTTVLEVGCGIGLIGLMMASECQRVIGVDSQSEVEEAEMTCEMNNVKNASFIMGSPNEVTSKITAAVKNSKTYAIINTSTAIGRSLEVMTCLRKITSINRIVMVTTLTRQSVRAILELARPTTNKIGNPFIPVKACVVDTLPVGPHFELVILMQRRPVHKVTAWMQRILNNKARLTGDVQFTELKAEPTVSDKTVPEIALKRNLAKPMKMFARKRGKASILANKQQRSGRLVENIMAKFKGKRLHSPDRMEGPPKKFQKKMDKFKGGRPDMPKSSPKKKERPDENPQLRINPLYDMKMRENKDQGDLRERLMNNRVDSDIIQQVKEHQAILEIAKEKLSGPAPAVDINTAKQLQNMLNMVLEQTNKLQSQLPPRSVWDRIAPPENMMERPTPQEIQNDTLLKGRFVQETGGQDIVITTPNQNFIENTEKPPFKKYNNIPPLEPNLVMPPARAIEKPTDERFHGPDFRKSHPENVWNRDKEKNRWIDVRNIRKPTSPVRNPPSPTRRHMSPLRHRVSPRRSPPRRYMSPTRRPPSPFRPCSPMRKQFSPQRRPVSPLRRPVSPSGRMCPPQRCDISPIKHLMPDMRIHDQQMRRQISPPPEMRRQVSPPPEIRRQMSPPSSMRRQISPPPVMRRQLSPVNRMMSPCAQDMFARHQMMMQQESGPSMRHSGSAFRPQDQRPMSPLRPHSSPKHQSPPRQLADEWDIPSRGSIEHNNWSRTNERTSEKGWQPERQSNRNWEQGTANESFFKSLSKPVNQDKWDISESSRDARWSGGGDGWMVKQSLGKSNQKESWSQNSENPWKSSSNIGPGGDNWNIRGKESFPSREDSWSDKARWESSQSKESWNQGDTKDDWNDLPEDARDPWGDDNNLGTKERWQKLDTSNQSSNWGRDGDKNNSWQNRGESWQNKSELWKNKSDSWQNKNEPWQNKSNQNKSGFWQSRSDNRQNKNDSWQSKNESWQNKAESWQPKSESWQNKPSSSWQNKGESWDKGDTWKNKGSSFTSKPQWSNNNSQNASGSRFTQQSEIGRSPLLKESSNWQSGNTTGPWKSQNLNPPPQRSFHSTQFKDRR